MRHSKQDLTYAILGSSMMLLSACSTLDTSNLLEDVCQDTNGVSCDTPPPVSLSDAGINQPGYKELDIPKPY